MGELLDRLNEMDPRPHAPGQTTQSLADQMAGAFRSASEHVNETIEAVQQPGMPLDTLRRYLRRQAGAGCGVPGRCDHDAAPIEHSLLAGQ